MAANIKRPDGQPDRRRANRAALSLTATMREGSRSKVQVRVIDISTGGCRIQCTSSVPVDACVWLAKGIRQFGNALRHKPTTLAH